MTVDSKEKGARAENQAKGLLKRYTDLNWQRVPSSGALHAQHKLKGDLYIPDANNLFCVEVKHYKEDKISSKLLTDKCSQISKWWSQAIRQGLEVDKEPLLIFKFDRSKFFVGFLDPPSQDYAHLWYSIDDLYLARLEDWLTHETPVFVKE